MKQASPNRIAFYVPRPVVIVSLYRVLRSGSRRWWAADLWSAVVLDRSARLQIRDAWREVGE